MSNSDHVTDLIPAYALGCLDENEYDQVASHLPGCPACQAELHIYQTVANDLALAAPEVSPPAHLKAHLMVSAKPSVASVAPVVLKPAWWQRLLTSRTPIWRPVALLAILVLLVSNVTLAWQMQQRPDPEEASAYVVELAGTEAMPGASGQVVASADGSLGMLVVDGLDTLGEDQQYQLWLVEGESDRVSGAVFSVGVDGSTTIRVNSPRPIHEYTGFGVTVEPAGGSVEPTGERVLGGTP